MVESVGGRQYRKREGLGGKESEPSFFCVEARRYVVYVVTQRKRA